MILINKLNDTHELLNKFDEIIDKDVGNIDLKKHLLLMSDDLAKYKDINKKNIQYGSNELNSKITNLLKRISEVEKNVKNKLIIAEKYASYLNT